MRKFIILAFILLTVGLQAQHRIQLTDSAQIQLVTCTQGEQVWSKYGHSGIRVVDPAKNLDIVFNYASST